MDFYIDDNIFKNPEKNEKEKKPKKPIKKKKNKKGIDFVDYAKDKGIDFNIEYENVEVSHEYTKCNNQKGKKFGNQQYKEKQQQHYQFKQQYDQQLKSDQINVNQSNQQRQFHQVKSNKFDQMDNKKQHQQINTQMPNNEGYQQIGYNTNLNNINKLNNNSHLIQQKLWYDQQQLLQQAQQQKNYLYQQQQIPQWNFQYQQMDNGAILVSTLEFLFSFDNIKTDRVLCSMMSKDGFVALPQLSTHPRLQKFILSKEIIEDLFNKVTYTDLEIRETFEGIIFFRNKNYNAYMGQEQAMPMQMYQYDNMQKMIMNNYNMNMMKEKNYPQQLHPFQPPQQQQYYPNPNAK